MTLQNKYFLVLMIAVVVCSHQFKIKPRIFGGNAAERGQFPYLASLRRSNWDGVIHQCGGAILTEKFILLAAHCIEQYSPVSEYLIAVNAFNRNDGEIYKVKQFHIHEYFISAACIDDIAIVELDDLLRFSDRVQPIEISVDFIGAGIDGIVAGYGETNDFITNLKYVHLKTMTNDECFVQYENVSHGKRMPIHENQTLCAYSGAAHDALCFGDSGGPFVVNNRVVGIVSWGKGCGIGKPEGFTRTSEFFDWIHDIINSH